MDPTLGTSNLPRAAPYHITVTILFAQVLNADIIVVHAFIFIHELNLRRCEDRFKQNV